jgi:adenosylcobinamide-phosphate synthase
MMNAAEHAAVVALGALAFDLVVGEPPNELHPVVWMGRLSRALRRRAPRAPASAFLYGAGMALVGPALFGLGSFYVVRAAAARPWLGLAVEIFLFKSSFALRALASAGGGVRRALERRDLEGARDALRSLVSRDTSTLDEPRLAAAAIESIAENASDSFVAPWLFYALLGVPGALAYRAANTLDAMIGYHGETEWLGKAAARLDDALNLVPSRLTALLIVACSGHPLRAVATLRRDARRTESPNAGHPMAAMAGALGVELEKIGHYRLGAGARLPTARDIARAVRVLALAAGTATLFAGVFLAWRSLAT